MSILQIGRAKRAFPQLHHRLYISVSSEGYGHSSRALALAQQFETHEVVLASYSYALERMERFGYPVLEVSQEYRFVGEGGSVDVGKTILENPKSLLGLNQIVQEEQDLMKEYGISLVIADGRIAPVLAAARLNLPCMVVTNQSAFYPFFEKDSPLVQAFGKSFDWVMKLWLSSAEEILIPDFPPPFTVCLPNLSDNFQVKKRTRFVGPLVAWKAEDIDPYQPTADEHPDSPQIVVSLGGHHYRKPLFHAVLEAAQQLPNIHFHCLTSFTSTHVPDNVTLHGFVQDCAPFFKRAELIITQAGHSTAMELLTLGKPALIVPDKGQMEQENNAKRMVELGVALQLEYGELNGSSLAQTIETCRSTPSLQQQVTAMAQEAARIHGASNAAQVLREYADRLLAY